MNQDETGFNHSAVNRLTALWALNESGLGGVLHAAKFPFTGIFVGGFAVILISLIARYSNYSFKAILKATAMVLMIKAAVSPHSPFPAYLAVSFQGLLGALITVMCPSSFITSVLNCLSSTLSFSGISAQIKLPAQSTTYFNSSFSNLFIN